MQGLTQGSVIDAEVPSHRMDSELLGADTGDGSLDFVDHRQDVTGIARVALGSRVAKIKPLVGSEISPVLRPNWAGQLLLPLRIGQ